MKQKLPIDSHIIEKKENGQISTFRDITLIELLRKTFLTEKKYTSSI